MEEKSTVLPQEPSEITDMGFIHESVKTAIERNQKYSTLHEQAKKWLDKAYYASCEKEFNEFIQEARKIVDQLHHAEPRYAHAETLLQQVNTLAEFGYHWADSLAKAKAAKLIIFEKITAFVQALKMSEKPEWIEDGRWAFRHFEVDEIENLLSQMEQALNVFESQPFCYLKWSIETPKIAEQGENRTFDIRKLKLIEALINQCFGNICEGTLTTALGVQGQIYIYPDKIKEITSAKVPATEESIACSTAEDYVKAIVAKGGNNANIQALILQAAQANILQQLEKISTESKVFKETNPDIIKTAIVKQLFDLQNRWYSSSCRLADISKNAEEENVQDRLGVEKNLNTLSKKRKRLILAAREYDLLPNSDHIDNYQPDSELFINSDINEIKPKIKEGIKKSIQVYLTERYDDQNSSKNPLDNIYASLAQRNYWAFIERIRRNIFAILSRPTTDEGRQLLVKNLQRINLSAVTNTYRAEEDKKSRIINSDFNGANLSDANLSSSRLLGAQFISATLQRVNFRNAGLVKSDFTHADLSEADLSDAYLEGADFNDANLCYAKLIRQAHGTLNWCEAPAHFNPKELLVARSLIGIKIGNHTLKTKYTPEERNALWEKLVTDYETLFNTANDPEEILRAAFDISPHTRHPESIYASTFNQLNVLLEKDNTEVCEVLLNLAYKRLMTLILEGARVSKKTETALQNRTLHYRSVNKLGEGKYGDIFGKDTSKIETLLKEISMNTPYYECLDAIDVCFKELKNHLDDDKKIEVALVATFKKLFFLPSMPFGFDRHADKAFTYFVNSLSELYGDNDTARNQTLISLFLNLIDSSGLPAFPDQFLFCFANTLYKTAGKDIGFYKKDENDKKDEVGKWRLILALLANAKDKDARDIQARVFNSLKKMDLKSGISNESFEQMLGVVHIFSHKDLKDLSFNYSTSEKDALLSQIKGKPIAIYEQAILNPNQVEIIQWPNDAETDLNFVTELVNKSWEHHYALDKKKTELLSQLKTYIDGENEPNQNQHQNAEKGVLEDKVEIPQKPVEIIYPINNSTDETEAIAGSSTETTNTTENSNEETKRFHLKRSLIPDDVEILSLDSDDDIFGDTPTPVPVEENKENLAWLERYIRDHLNFEVRIPVDKQGTRKIQFQITNRRFHSEDKAHAEQLSAINLALKEAGLNFRRDDNDPSLFSPAPGLKTTMMEKDVLDKFVESYKKNHTFLQQAKAKLLANRTRWEKVVDWLQDHPKTTFGLTVLGYILVIIPGIVLTVAYFDSINSTKRVNNFITALGKGDENNYTDARAVSSALPSESMKTIAGDIIQKHFNASQAQPLINDAPVQRPEDFASIVSPAQPQPPIKQPSEVSSKLTLGKDD